MTTLANVRRTVTKEFAITLHEVRIFASFQDPLSPQPGALVVEIQTPNYRTTETYEAGSQTHSTFLALVNGKIDSDPTIEKLPEDAKPSDAGQVGVGAQRVQLSK